MEKDIFNTQQQSPDTDPLTTLAEGIGEQVPELPIEAALAQGAIKRRFRLGSRPDEQAADSKFTRLVLIPHEDQPPLQ